MRSPTACLIAFCLFQCCADAARIAPYRFPIQCGEPNAFLPYVSSHKIDRPNNRIQRIIIAIHSSGFDALKCNTAIQQAAEQVPGAKASTLIVAPQFQGVGAIRERIPAGLIAWKVSPYRGSSLACIGPAKKNLTLSAYAALDQLLAYLNDKGKFPSLKVVKVAGHSSRGQMAHRYAVAGRYSSRNRIPIHFVPSAPSSFAYLNEERPIIGLADRFEKPTSPADPNYNNWGCGLDSLYRYCRHGSADFLRQRYANRRVLYLCGGRDNNPNDGSLSKTKAALMQGRHRRERLNYYYQHVIRIHGEKIRKRHALIIAPGVDHNGFRAYTSPGGLKALFDHDPKDADGDGKSDWQEWLEGW